MTEVTQCCDGVGFEMGQAIASTSDKVPRKSKNNEVGEKMFLMLGNIKEEMFGKKDEDKLASLRLQLHDAMEAARNADDKHYDMLKCLEEYRKDSSTSATFIQITERKLKKAEMAVVETEEIVEEVKKQIEEVKTSLQNK